MKFKYFFALILILTILFSLGTVMASENIDDVPCDDACLAIDTDDNQDSMSTMDTVDEDVPESVSSSDAIDDDYGAVSSSDAVSEDVPCFVSSADAKTDNAQGSLSDLNVDNADVQLSANEDCEDSIENQNVLKSDKTQKNLGDSPSTGDTDLAIYIELGDVEKVTGDFEVTFKVPLIITAVVSDGIAYNATVYHTIPSEFTYVSQEASQGTYDPSTGIWKIGALDNTTNATLKIFTNITKKGTYEIFVNATTVTTDRNISDNDMKCTITVSSKISSNTTRTSDNQNGAQHDDHPGSNPYGEIGDDFGDDDGGDDPPGGNGEDDNPGEIGGDDPPGGNGEDDQNTNKGGDSNTNNGENNNEGNGNSNNQGTTNNGNNQNNNGNKQNTNNGENGNSNNGGNSGLDSTGSNSNSENNNLLKSVDGNIITKATQSLTNTLEDIFNLDSDDESSNSSVIVKAIDAYDYTQVPMIIFGLFLVGLAGIVAYDKIKS